MSADVRHKAFSNITYNPLLLLVLVMCLEVLSTFGLVSSISWS